MKRGRAEIFVVIVFEWSLRKINSEWPKSLNVFSTAENLPNSYFVQAAIWEQLNMLLSEYSPLLKMHEGVIYIAISTFAHHLHLFTSTLQKIHKRLVIVRTNVPPHLGTPTDTDPHFICTHAGVTEPDCDHVAAYFVLYVP